jgi:hypothetical protein
VQGVNQARATYGLMGLRNICGTREDYAEEKALLAHMTPEEKALRERKLGAHRQSNHQQRISQLESKLAVSQAHQVPQASHLAKLHAYLEHGKVIGRNYGGFIPPAYGNSF